jgi:hypothetical protein
MLLCCLLSFWRNILLKSADLLQRKHASLISYNNVGNQDLFFKLTDGFQYTDTMTLLYIYAMLISYFYVLFTKLITHICVCVCISLPLNTSILCCAHSQQLWHVYLQIKYHRPQMNMISYILSLISFITLTAHLQLVLRPWKHGSVQSLPRMSSWYGA